MEPMSPIISAAASAVSRPRIKGRKLRNQKAECPMCRGAHSQAVWLTLSTAARDVIAAVATHADPTSSVLETALHSPAADYRRALSARSGPAHDLSLTFLGDNNRDRTITPGDLTVRLDAGPAPASNRSNSRAPEDDRDRETTRRQEGRSATKKRRRVLAPHQVRPPCATLLQPGRLFQGNRFMRFAADERSSH
jgi:hypothetical protein